MSHLRIGITSRLLIKQNIPLKAVPKYKCTMTSAKFHYSESDFVKNTCALKDASVKKLMSLSKFDQLVCQGWDEAMKHGHFRYNLDDTRSRVVPGKHGYVLQLNLKRGTERRKPEFIDSLSKPYDPNKFNFTKVRPAEILFEMCPRYENDANGETAHDHDIRNGYAAENVQCIANDKSCPSRHLVVINVSPLEYGHILLVPDADHQIAQKLTLHGTRLALDMLLLSAHPGWRVGFNSLCALASVNHQHLHAWYLESSISIEYAQVQPVCEGLYELEGEPTKALALQLHGSTVPQLAERVFTAVSYLQGNDIAHNVYMTRGPVFGESAHSDNTTVRVYIWPRKSVIAKALTESADVFNVAVAELAGHVPMYGAKNEHIDQVVFNVAVAELAGHIPMFAPDMFDDLTEDYISDRLQEQMFSQERFDEIKDNIKQALITAGLSS